MGNKELTGGNLDNQKDHVDMTTANMQGEGETVIGSWTAKKKHKSKIKVERIVMITDQYFYHCKSKKEVSRKVAFEKIVGVTKSIAPECSKCIVHVDKQRDFWFQFSDKMMRGDMI